MTVKQRVKTTQSKIRIRIRTHVPIQVSSAPSSKVINKCLFAQKCVIEPATLATALLMGALASQALAHHLLYRKIYKIRDVFYLLLTCWLRIMKNKHNWPAAAPY